MATKAKLVQELVTKHELPKKDAAAFVETVIDTIHDTLIEGDSLLITGLCTFKTKTRAARKGHNPQTGEPIDIAESKVISFKNSSLLKEDLNK